MFQHTVSLRWNSYFCLEWSCFPWILSSPTCLSEHFTQVSGWKNNLKNKWLRQTLGTQNVIKNKRQYNQEFWWYTKPRYFSWKGKRQNCSFLLFIIHKKFMAGKKTPYPTQMHPWCQCQDAKGLRPKIWHGPPNIRLQLKRERDRQTKKQRQRQRDIET